MKTNIFRKTRQSLVPAVCGLRAGGIVTACLLLSAAASWAQLPAVSTISGGRAGTPRYGYVDGNTAEAAQFHTPIGLALDNIRNRLYVADRDNNAVRKLDLGLNITLTFATNGVNRISQPVGVAVDNAGNLYVLNRGNGSNGNVLSFNQYGNFLGTNATSLVNAEGIALDGSGNIYVTANNNQVIRIAPGIYPGVKTTVATVTNAGTLLRGVAILDSGSLVICDSGRHGVLVVNPASGAWAALTGFNGAGDTFGTSAFAQFNQPYGIAVAGSNMVVVADYGNHRVKTVDASGTVCNLYGVCSDNWVVAPGDPSNFPGWWDGSGCGCEIACAICDNYAEARLPAGVVVAQDGSVYSTEDYYHLIRQTTDTGLSSPNAPGQPPLFNDPRGVALDSSSGRVYVADRGNNAIQVINLSNNVTTTFVNAASGLNQPVDALVDSSGNLFVLNQGTGSNGSIQKFDTFGNLLATSASGLALPTALTRDGAGNLYVAEQSGAVRQFNNGFSNLVATVSTAGVQLQGIALFDDGTIVVSDAGNHVIWQISAATRTVSLFTGTVGVPGNTLGSAGFAKLNQPRHLARAAGDLAVVADSGNNRLVVMDRSGAITNVLNSTNALVWFGGTNDPVGPSSTRFVPMALPSGVAVGSGGGVFASELLYNDIREVLNTGLVPPGFGGGGGTNVVVVTPVISPNSGYYPMGQLITVSSPNPDVFYTTDGTEPSTNSLRVVMNGNTGTIHWFNPTNDLTGLAVKAFAGTNASATVRGLPVSANTVGIPSAPSSSGAIYAGIGSTIVVPVVVNLRTNDQVKSYQFRVEVTPTSGGSPIAGGSSGFFPLNIGTNDFVLLAAANKPGSTGTIAVVSYTTNVNTTGLQISALGTEANISFQSHAVVTLLKVPIPVNANAGDTYSLSVLYPSATSDGLNNSIALTAMPAATILVTNLPYTVGDSASPYGAWYNAGGFGDGDLVNADVNNAFYAALGLRVPYAFSDVFNAMDAYPPDASGFVGGDGQIRFLDWELILRRSLRLDTNNWARAWSAGGTLVNTRTTLAPPPVPPPPPLVVAPWYKQVLLGAVSVGNLAAGSQASVPVYVKLGDGSTLAGLQFRAVVSALNGALPLNQAPEFIAAAGMPAPALQQSFETSATAFGWPLGSVNFQSRSSNFVGWLRFTLPPGSPSGGNYIVSFANADGSPDLYTQYDFETRSGSVALNVTAPPASICSDEWKLHFFGSLTAPTAADLADPDADGVPNWMEYLAGTDPTDPNSKLRFLSMDKQVAGGQPQLALHWLTAPGKAYEVQWSARPGGIWNSLGTVSGDGSLTTYTDSAGASARFYRLRVLP